LIERDTQRRVVGTPQCSLGGRCVLNLIQRPETLSALTLQGFGPKLKPFALRERTWLGAALQDIGNLTDLVSSFVFHDILQEAWQIDCQLFKLYASGNRPSSISSKTVGRSTAWAASALPARGFRGRCAAEK